jgi:hypothetical protein
MFRCCSRQQATGQRAAVKRVKNSTLDCRVGARGHPHSRRPLRHIQTKEDQRGEDPGDNGTDEAIEFDYQLPISEERKGFQRESWGSSYNILVLKSQKARQISDNMHESMHEM